MFLAGGVHFPPGGDPVPPYKKLMSPLLKAANKRPGNLPNQQAGLRALARPPTARGLAES